VKVEVRLFATLGAFLPEGTEGDGMVLTVPEGSTLGEIVRGFRIPPGLAFMTVVNGHETDPERVLVDGDSIAMFPPLAGGA
jgi:molybdopterin converting factor small subunit